jgi:glucokinase
MSAAPQSKRLTGGKPALEETRMSQSSHAERGSVLGADVGGSSVKSALVLRAGVIAGEPQVSPVDNTGSAHAILATLAKVLRSGLADDRTCNAVAIACPGPCDYKRGVFGRHEEGKFTALEGIDLRDELRWRLRRPGLKLRFINDAEAAVVAEALFGAGRPFARAFGITLGTGLGACLVVDHTTIVEMVGAVAPGQLYNEPFDGRTADAVFSERGLRARLQAAHAPDPDPSARGPQAAVAYAEFGADLARLLAPLVTQLGADGVVITGGISAAFKLFEPTLAAGLAVPVVAGELGAAAGPLGAAEALFGAVRRASEPSL